MTREEFIDILERKGYSYELEGDKIVVTGKGVVDLWTLKTLPPDVVFKNGWDVHLRALKTLPPGVVFKNGGYVHLESLETIPPGVVLKNGGDIDLESLVGEWFGDWKGNIKGIKSKRLLNWMISKGLFER